MVTSSRAASVPTTSTARWTVSCLTASTSTTFAVVDPARFCAPADSGLAHAERAMLKRIVRTTTHLSIFEDITDFIENSGNKIRRASLTHDNPGTSRQEIPGPGFDKPR